MTWNGIVKPPSGWGMREVLRGAFQAGDFDAFGFDTGEKTYVFVHPPMPAWGVQQKQATNWTEKTGQPPAWS